MAAVGERNIAYDARGLAEPIAEAPRNAVVEDGVATFDARDLTTRTINLELRRLLYEEGIDEVVIQNPQGRHSLGVGILRRCKITFEGSLGYFACGLIDGPEIHIKGRVGWSSCENMMSGVVVVDGNGGSLTGAAMRGGDLVVKGRVGARTGIDQKGGTIIVTGSVGSMTGFMMQRGRQIICGDAGNGLGDSMYDGTIYVGGKVKSLGIDCVPGEWTDADTELIERKFRIYGLGTPPEFQKFVCGKVLYNYDSLEPVGAKAGDLMFSAKRSFRRSGTNAAASRPSGGKTPEVGLLPSGSGERGEALADGPGRKDVLGRSRIFTPEVINDIHIKSELGRYRMRGFSIFKPIPHWDELVFLPGTLTRFVIEGYREKCDTKTVLGARFAKNPLELEIPIYITGMSFGALLAGGEDGAREGRLDGRHRDLLGRGRDDPAGARPLDQVVLPVHPVAVRVQPAPPDAGRRVRVLHRAGLQGRSRRPPDGSEGDRAGGGDALAPGRHRPALAGAAPGLARPGRPVAEGAGDPGGDRLPDPDPAQARRLARLRRRPDGRQVRAGHHLPGRCRRRDGRRARTSRPRKRGSR